MTAGFVGKFYLFNAAVAAGWTWLAVAGVVMSVVSAYYYLGVVVAMYMRPPAAEDRWAVVSPSAAFALAVSVAVTLLLGIWPAPLLRAAREAARSLCHSRAPSLGSRTVARSPTSTIASRRPLGRAGRAYVPAQERRTASSTSGSTATPCR